MAQGGKRVHAWHVQDAGFKMVGSGVLERVVGLTMQGWVGAGLGRLEGVWAWVGLRGAGLTMQDWGGCGLGHA